MRWSVIARAACRWSPCSPARFFAGISGSAIAQASAIGSSMIPAMARRAFRPPTAPRWSPMSAVIDPLIPPSITMIVFGVLSGTSIGADVHRRHRPGLLLVVGLCSSMPAGGRGATTFPLMPKVTGPIGARRCSRAIPALMLPVIIVGGVKSGIFTVTESAAVAVAYALLVGLPASRADLAARIWEALSPQLHRHLRAPLHPRHGEHRRLRSDASSRFRPRSPTAARRSATTSSSSC